MCCIESGLMGGPYRRKEKIEKDERGCKEEQFMRNDSGVFGDGDYLSCAVLCTTITLW
jgi:hypothetical protein